MAATCWLWQVLSQAVGAEDARLQVKMQHVSHNEALRYHMPRPAVFQLNDIDLLMIAGRLEHAQCCQALLLPVWLHHRS